MKFSKFILLMFLISGLLACGGDDDNGGDGINVGADGCGVSWTVNGENYSKNDLVFCVLLDNTFNMSSSVSGGDFMLQIDPITSTGTFVADPTDLTQTVLINMVLNDGTRIVIKEGEIVVNELSSSKVSGTFNGSFFDVQDINQTASFNVTNGQFEANL